MCNIAKCGQKIQEILSQIWLFSNTFMIEANFYLLKVAIWISSQIRIPRLLEANIYAMARVAEAVQLAEDVHGQVGVVTVPNGPRVPN